MKFPFLVLQKYNIFEYEQPYFKKNYKKRDAANHIPKTLSLNYLNPLSQV